MNYILNYTPDRKDARDAEYADLRPGRLFKSVFLPKTAYLHEDNFYEVVNQGGIGSCVGHGVTGNGAYTLDYVYDRTGGVRPVIPSRLFAYYNARQDKLNDTGAYIRDGIKAVAKFGLCDEKYWPYVESNFAVRPPDIAYEMAAPRAKGIEYYRINSIRDMQDCLAQGFPIVYGMTLFNSFFSTGKDGVMPMPAPHEAPAGGHCMLIIGYSMKRRAFFVRNSWGKDWGYHGHVWIPFEYIARFASDFWTIRRLGR